MPDLELSELSPWKILDRRIVYECLPYLCLERQTVELPDGRVIDDYHRLAPPDVCVICPITKEGAVIMLRAYRHGIGHSSLMLPGGVIEDGEVPIDAAKRELLEETGYSSDCWGALGNFIPLSNYGCGRLYIFKCTLVRKIQMPSSGDLEVSSVETFTKDQLSEMTSLGQIESLSSIAAISLAMCTDL